MKVLLNGATGGSHFGDFLFAKIFQDSVVKLVGHDNVFWYESRYNMSDFFRRHLNYNNKYKLKDIDALICISGGYFCGDDHTLKDYIIRYLSYFRLCIKCIRRKIPIAIIGVEVGKPKSKVMEIIQRYILKRASLLIVRNNESLVQLKEYGITNGICTTDTAHALKSNFKINIDTKSLTNKKVFLHVQLSNINATERIIPVFNKFLKNHPEYSVIIGTDQYTKNKDALNEISKKIACSKVSIYHYDNPMDLCKLLLEVDFIITPKLHVGIIGATFSKSVVSFSIHSEKIQRFYHQLKEEDRTLSMENFDEKKALEMMESFHNLPMNVPEVIFDLANKNLQSLELFLKNLNDGAII